ncbi:MAG: formylglycine-generating enzyme family protein [Cyanobacteria bacterium P01_C01_bin.38]
MSNSSPPVTKSNPSKPKDDLTTRRIRVFTQRYGEKALELAIHAAFPLTITSDLLYCLRETFVKDCPWYAVGDIAASGLCKTIGYDLYEMEDETKHGLLDLLLKDKKIVKQRLRELIEDAEDETINDLIKRLHKNKNSKNSRFRELSDFMAKYILNRFKEEKNSYRKEWIPLSYLMASSQDENTENAVDAIKKQLKQLLESLPEYNEERIKWEELKNKYVDALQEEGLTPLLEKPSQDDNSESELTDSELTEEEKQIAASTGVKLKPFEYEVTVISPSFEFETVTVNNRGETINTEQHRAIYYVEYLGEKVGEPAELKLEMVAIPGGTFEMGSPEDEPKRRNDESPQHTVTVQPFFMSKYLVTQAQWRFVAQLPQVERELESEPSEFKGDDLPVELVSWYDAVEFCARLSNHTGRRYSLPTEAEWEYACRAVTTTPHSGSNVAPGGTPHNRADSPFHFGETITGDLANYNASKTFANEAKGEYREKTTPVGQFPPNTFGLYDMHGNVDEWCLDDYHDNYEDAPTDGSAWFDEENNNLSQKQGRTVLRGGSWYLNPNYCRSASRDLNYDSRDNYNFNIGFRVVCAVGRT